MTRTTFCVVCSLSIVPLALLAQTRMKPTAPGTSGDPVWQGVLKMADGRTFVTDGGLAIDASLAKPAKLPDRVIPPKVMQDYLSVTNPNEYALSDLSAAMSGKTYSTPNGVAMSATYINFLRRILPGGTARLRVGEKRQPIVIVADGRAVGVLMPVAQ